MHRYAVYFTPPRDHPLTQAAAIWLGRCAFGVEHREAAARRRSQDRWRRDPARYGFHATLKPPFRLKEGATPGQLEAAFGHFCDAHEAVGPVPLAIGRIGPFFALVPRDPAPRVDALAEAAVRAFEPFRSPLDEGEIARRRPERLSQKQRHYLQEWGYPYIFDEFRFHMTLTGPIEADAANRIEPLLVDRFAHLLDEPVDIDGIALFGEPEQRGEFNVLTWRSLRQPATAGTH